MGLEGKEDVLANGMISLKVGVLQVFSGIVCSP